MRWRSSRKRIAKPRNKQGRHPEEVARLASGHLRMTLLFVAAAVNEEASAAPRLRLRATFAQPVRPFQALQPFLLRIMPNTGNIIPNSGVMRIERAAAPRADCG